MRRCKIADVESCPKGKTICCQCCEEKCDSQCTEETNPCPESEEIVEENLQVMEKHYPDILRGITDLMVQKKQLEEQEEIMRDLLQKAMEERGITKFENEFLSFTYKGAYMRKSFDKDKFKKAHPEIDLDKYQKESPVKESVTIKVK